MDPFETFDMLSAEGAMFAAATERYKLADTRPGQLDALTAALGHAFGALEHVALLRVHEPDLAEGVAREWRELVLDIARTEREIVEDGTAGAAMGGAR